MVVVSSMMMNRILERKFTYKSKIPIFGWGCYAPMAMRVYLPQ